MKQYLHDTLKDAVSTWIALAAAILTSSILFAVLSVNGVSENTSLLTAFLTLTAIIILHLTFSAIRYFVVSGLRMIPIISVILIVTIVIGVMVYIVLPLSIILLSIIFVAGGVSGIVASIGFTVGLHRFRQLQYRGLGQGHNSTDLTAKQRENREQ